MTHQTRCVSPTVCCPLWPSLRDPWPQFPVGGHQGAFALLENIWSQSDLWYQESFSSSRNPLLVILEVAVRGEACEIFRADHLSSPGANTVDPPVPPPRFVRLKKETQLQENPKTCADAECHPVAATAAAPPMIVAAGRRTARKGHRGRNEGEMSASVPKSL